MTVMYVSDPLQKPVSFMWSQSAILRIKWVDIYEIPKKMHSIQKYTKDLPLVLEISEK